MDVTNYYLCPEEDQSILVVMLARISARFLTGIDETLTVHDDTTTQTHSKAVHRAHATLDMATSAKTDLV